MESSRNQQDLSWKMHLKHLYTLNPSTGSAKGFVSFQLSTGMLGEFLRFLAFTVAERANKLAPALL